MGDLAYRLKGRYNDHYGPLTPPGLLDNALDNRLEEHKGLYRLGRWKDGSLRDPGPWRTEKEAVSLFPPRIIAQTANVGAVWRIESKSEDWFLNIRAIEYPMGDQVLAAAKTQLGVRYVWGAEQPGVAFDCSGLTKWAWSSVGVELPHEAEAQRQASHKLDTPRHGCLVEFDYNEPHGGRATHVGLWLKPGYLIDTRSPDGEPVAIRRIEPPPDLLGFYWPNGARDD